MESFSNLLSLLISGIMRDHQLAKRSPQSRDSELVAKGKGCRKRSYCAGEAPPTLAAYQGSTLNSGESHLLPSESAMQRAEDRRRLRGLIPRRLRPLVWPVDTSNDFRRKRPTSLHCMLGKISKPLRSATRTKAEPAAAKSSERHVESGNDASVRSSTVTSYISCLALNSGRAEHSEEGVYGSSAILFRQRQRLGPVQSSQQDRRHLCISSHRRPNPSFLMHICFFNPIRPFPPPLDAQAFTRSMRPSHIRR